MSTGVKQPVTPMNHFPWVKLWDCIVPVERAVRPVAGTQYRQIGVRLWGQGAYERQPIDGADTKYANLYQVQAGDVVINKIWARNGSVSVVSDELAGAVVSGEFPTFSCIPDRLAPRWFLWITKTKWFWSACDEKSRGTSGKNRIRPEKFLEIEIPLPPLSEQKRIVKRIEEVASRTRHVLDSQEKVREELGHLLMASYLELVSHACDYLSMSEAAPLVRRPIRVEADSSYPELGIRSFGKGTFHKPDLAGLDVGTKKLFEIHEGDLLFNIVFAWEGAVAVARQEDHGRVGSHRFLTCVPKKETVLSFFLKFHFLTRRGLDDLLQASPGGAGRNRTLGLTALANIQVPIPPYEEQLRFRNLLKLVSDVEQEHSEQVVETHAMLQSILLRAFKGEF